MKRNIALLSLALFSLAACKGKVEPIAADTCPHERMQVEQFSLCIPPGWGRRIEQYGNEGSLVVLIRKKEAERDSMKVHVKKGVLEEPAGSSIALAERAVALSREQAPGYEAVSTDPMTTSNGKETLLHTFDARPSAASDPIRYYQYVTTYGDIAYSFTAIVTPDAPEEEIEVLLDIFKSARFTS